MTRVGAGALMVVFALAQHQAWQHQTELRHVVCPEHGELLHASASSQPAADNRDAISATESTSHDECELPLGQCADRKTNGRRWLTFRPQAVFALVQALACQPIFSLAVLHLAPKTSPPKDA